MTLGFLFWLAMLLALLFNGWWSFRPNGDRTGFGGSLIWWLILLCLGLKTFGFPITG